MRKYGIIGKNPLIFRSILVLALAFAMILFGARLYSRSLDAKELAFAEDTIRRYAVMCYAVEGRYPDSLAALESRYGLLLDNERYLYHYVCLGDNLLPEVTVFELKR